ncbi:DUF2891 domain-containing protein [Sphingomonas nostoxanthinifaciens]|uniref:DUF2891 domain-containing protein n=1 Tax=Sphingomonas nostoxanthinifaciens TaxID=2872652 RepID=UPI001CC21569|nr:DUF2891 domain-containing protein [Sphingomonas nostoxanthinifaciens]UAK23139.1 DUF2891 domain-containing protein [Sphingomonas nostoxanthinifaciens]
MDAADAKALPKPTSGTGRRLSPERAGNLVDITLGHVGRQFPFGQGEVLLGPADLALTPRDFHPIFHGSYDWHSCVHGYWLLTRLNRLYPDLPQRAATIAQLDQAFTPAKVAGEIAFFKRPFAEDYERPYGWCWFLKLAAELHERKDEAGRRWLAAVTPMARFLAGRFGDYIQKLPRPTRDGAHPNSAFNMVLALDYADSFGDAALRDQISRRAIDWFSADVAPTQVDYGPMDFLSPILTEAELMRRVLPRDRFLAWLDRYLPRLAAREPAILFQVAVVTDPTDGVLAHLDGVNLSRAWAMNNLARTLGQDPRAEVLRHTAATFLDASLDKVQGGYMSEHWLSTYALLALESIEEGK